MINQVHIVLSGAFKYALRMELVRRNPVPLVSPTPVKRTEVPPPNIPSIRQVLDVARSDGHILYPAMHVIVYTGMRRVEAMGLLWEHVNLQEGHIRVENSMVKAKPIPRWDVHFREIDDDRKHSTAPHITFSPNWVGTDSAV